MSRGRYRIEYTFEGISDSGQQVRTSAGKPTDDPFELMARLMNIIEGHVAPADESWTRLLEVKMVRVADDDDDSDYVSTKEIAPHSWKGPGV